MGDLDRWARDHRHRKKRQQIEALRRRRRVVFDRVVMPKFEKGVEELRSYDWKIRSLLTGQTEQQEQHGSNGEAEVHDTVSG